MPRVQKNDDHITFNTAVQLINHTPLTRSISAL